jgi:hypothetical protein
MSLNREDELRGNLQLFDQVTHYPGTGEPLYRKNELSSPIAVLKNNGRDYQDAKLT